MADVKNDNVNKWVDAVTRMIELTQQGLMQWVAMEATGPAADENRTSAVFRSSYNHRILRLYERKVSSIRLVDSVHDRHSFPNFFALKYEEPKYEKVWESEVVLEFIATDGTTLWSFPKVSALRDLLTAVQYQVAGVNEFIDSLLQEPNAA